METAQEPLAPVAAAPTPLELTPRALIMGCLIGVLLSAGNGYVGLKTPFIDGGSVVAALLGFAFFATFKLFARTPYTPLETNITATVASSAAIMGYAIGLPGAIPALQMMGTQYPGWALVVWGIALGAVGVVMALVLRRKLIVTERLPFPTGAATAEVIETISASRETAMHRARFLVGAMVIGAAIAWFRDGRPSFIPAATAFPITLLGVSLANLSVGVSFSPLMFSVGMLIGVRYALSLLVGGFAAWIVGAPLLVRYGVVADGSYTACASWLVWPGVGLLLASSFVPLAMDWRAIVRSFRDIPGLLRRRRGGAADRVLAGDLEHSRLGKPLLFVAVLILVLVGHFAFHLSPLTTLVGVLISLVLASVAGRAAGETDMAPSGPVGTIAQLLFAGNGPVSSLLVGSISAGVSAQTAQTLWAFKAGDRLRASGKAQFWAQLLGAVVGAVVAVPVYLVMTTAYGLGTEAMPAPSAMSWKATAEAVRGGLSTLPPHALLAGALAFLVGTVLSLLGRTRLGRFLPAPAAMGMSLLMPFSLALTAALGGLAWLTIKRLRPQTSDGTLMAAAAGGIAGESVMGVIIAALIATGLL